MDNCQSAGKNSHYGHVKVELSLYLNILLINQISIDWLIVNSWEKC